MLETKSQKALEIDKGVIRAESISKQRFGFVQFTHKNKKTGKTGKKHIVLVIDKRQKFVIAVLLLSTSLFLTEYSGIVVVSSGFIVSFVFALLTNLLLFWAVRKDFREAFSFNFFILPFFYSLAF